MADDNFRSQRNRGPAAPRSADISPRGQLDDPLAELARLIGQGDPMSDFGRDARRPSARILEEADRGADWVGDAPYADTDEPTQEHDGYNGRYEPRLVEPAASRRAVAAVDAEPSGDGEPPHGQRLPAFLPRAQAGDYEYDDEAQDGDDQAYELEGYEPEAPEPRRRGGFVVVAAVLGLAVLGTAGAFAYRAMFGASMLPSLPPIIKADNGPTKIVPPSNPSKAGASGQADAGASDASEKLVSRQEQPVEMPVNAAPRVVSTIPIFPDPGPGQASGLQSGAPPVAVAPAAVPPPALAVAPSPAAAAAPTPPGSAALLPEPKKIHTVAIHPDQFGGTEAAPPMPAAPAVSAAPPSSTAPVRAAAPPVPRPVAQSAPRPAPAPPAQPGGNAPLSIVPDQGAAPVAPPPRTRTALAQPAAAAPAASEPAPAAGGGYSVQVSSQRSEAEAQAAFRALQAKFPKELGGRAPLVRRADLGAKGVYYRALVGPFASMEQAAQMCSSLKAAGGNCIVQHD